MVDWIFEKCVLLLVWLANQLGMTYEAINVWIFVVIWPALTFVLAAVVVWQQYKIRQLLSLVTRR